MTSELRITEERPPLNPFFLLACMLSALPLWLATYPPMVDIPLHASQLATLLRFLHGTEHFSSLFQVNWFTPYWGGYVLAALFGSFLPVSTAIKCTLSLAVAATPLAASRLRALVNHETYLDWLFLPIGYGLAFQWGFFNFIVGIPFVFFFLDYAICYLYKPTFKKGILVFFWLLLLFTTHVLILLFSVGCVLFIELLTSKDFKASLKKLLPLYLSVLIAFIWLFLTKASEQEVSSPILWGISSGKIYVVLISAAGCFNKILIGLLGISVIISSPRFKNMNILKNWRAIPFVYTVLILIFVPHHAFGVSLLAERFSVFLLPFYSLSVNSDGHQVKALKIKRNTLWYGLLSLLVLIGNACSIYSFDKDTAGLKTVIKIMDNNKRMVSLVFDKNDSYSISQSLIHHYMTPVFIHTPVWYFAEKDGLGDVSFMPYNCVMRYKNHNAAEASVVQSQIQWVPQYFNWKKWSALYDYFVLYGDSASTRSARLKAESVAHLHLVYTDGKWWLYSSFMQPRVLKH